MGRSQTAQHVVADDDVQRRAQLTRMKRTALLLLLGALLLGLLAHWQHDAHPAWPYVAAFAEAATVGAMADWFAVVALFRHPLGLPIWHTAIIPRNKSRIARNLGSFVVEHFFTPTALTQRLGAYNPARRAGAWLVHAAGSTRLARQVADTLAGLAETLLDGPGRARLSAGFARQLAQVDLATLGARALDAYLSGTRQQALADALLAGAARRLDDAPTRERLIAWLTESLHLEDVKVMGVSLGGTLRPLVHSAAERLIARLQGEVQTALDDPQHAWREILDVYLHECVLRLKADARTRSRVQRALAEWLADPASLATLDAVWLQLRAGLQADIRRADSRMVAACAVLLRSLGERLGRDTRLQGRLNRRVFALLPGLVERYRPTVAVFIADKLDSWSEEEVSQRIELAIGRDLQFIRINGTLVGGLIGLALYALARVFY